MRNISIAVHGGAGEDSEFIQLHQTDYKTGLEDAVNAGYKILQRGGSTLDAVEQAVRSLEDNPLFNSGRGSALNNKGEVEMDASIMDGNKLKAGAVSMVRNVKNPVTCARFIMENTAHVFLSGNGALEIAKEKELELEVDSYFITKHQGDIGAIAVDAKGNMGISFNSQRMPRA